MNFRSGRKGFGIYEPKTSPSPFQVISSHEVVKQRMLQLKDNAEDMMEEYLSYKMIGKAPALSEEKLQAALLKLFITCRPHIKNFIYKQHERITKAKRPHDRAMAKEIYDYNKSNFELLEGSYREMKRGNKINDERLYDLLSFLGQFMYDIGVSRIELPDRDPIREFSESAYGQDFDTEGDDNGGS